MLLCDLRVPPLQFGTCTKCGAKEGGTVGGMNKDEKDEIEKQIEALFVQMDTDNSNSIEELEALALCHYLDISSKTYSPWTLLVKYDENNDGKISKEEFTKAFKQEIIPTYFHKNQSSAELHKCAPRESLAVSF